MLTRSYEETINLGEAFGKLLKKGFVICLNGDLASGKTTFTKGIGKALNIKEVINSPTFTILKIYEGDIKLYHIDAYRLENASYDLGLSEFEDDGIMVIEWPMYYKQYLPKEYISINFKYVDDNTREITFSSNSEYYNKIIGELHV